MSSKYIYTSYIRNRAQSDDTDEKFILEVQKQECIWNVYSKHYNMKCLRNREIKKKAWDDIGRAMNENWDQLPEDEKHKKVYAMTRKWANIRKYYTDEVRKSNSESPVRKKQRRRYHSMLTFLDASVLRRRIQRIQDFKNIGREYIENETSTDSESNELYIVEDVNELEKMNAENKDLNAPMLNGNGLDIPGPVLLTPKEEPKSPVPAQIVSKNPEIMKLLTDTPKPVNPPWPKPAQSPSTTLNKTSSLDLTAEASKKFLLSLLPEIMSLNVKQNMQFRLGILDLLNAIKFRVNHNA
ncbi:uncharacterized protein [Epargyreus clarus]|uniref:uncharacterized protein n=1 Tax=Epargyreus clarus TaxID=520877 RepID=UPI003C2AF13A